jgi:hypothetical protein
MRGSVCNQGPATFRGGGALPDFAIQEIKYYTLLERDLVKVALEVPAILELWYTSS